jgi:heme-degrading monooxygenase HmoA
MIAVIFEVEPAAGRAQDYFDLAAEMKPMLETAAGFISIERFESLARPGRFLSLSFWEDEASVAGWRNLAEHRIAQGKGRGGIFQDYRLRVAGVIRDYGMFDRAQAPDDSKARHGA